MSQTSAGSPAASDLTSRLEKAVEWTIAQAGPRYSPAVNPDAPNLEIRALHQAACALGMSAGFAARARELKAVLNDAYDRERHVVDPLFKARAVTPVRLCDGLEQLAGAATPAEAKGKLLEIRRHSKLVRSRLTAAVHAEDTALQFRSQSRSAGSAERDERERIEIRLAALRRLEEILEQIAEFTDGPEGQLLTRSNSILLLGEWGTGKTHFLCDLALQALADGCPAVVVLANTLRTDLEPLDAIAQATGLADTGADLVHQLESAAANGRGRALVLIDAVNESDREAWRRRLPRLVRLVRAHERLGLVVSCRTPYDQSMITSAARTACVQLNHPGFADQEFDAQLEFFDHYRLPALHVPLLTPEFSRPLFLRLMCEAIKGLGKRNQKAKLRELAAGQKAMTYVLEQFVKAVGTEVEKTHALSPTTCWYVMKGFPGKNLPGFAGVLAANRREWMTRDEALEQVQAQTAAVRAKAEAIIADMTAAGLLVAHSVLHDGAQIDALLLPYQRFSDHLVARHLLDEHLKCTTEAQLRRCFYANRRLGAVFAPDRSGRHYAEPGIASALMIEFPERVKRLAEKEGAPTELVAYLPRDRRLLHPFAEAFLEGLCWRSPVGLGSGAEKLVLGLLERSGAGFRARTYEMLYALAVRGEEPLGSRWLLRHLAAMTMAERDAGWSEFLRALDPSSHVHRLLAWVEREQRARIQPADVDRTLQVIVPLLTTTDRRLRDRATRALVQIGQEHPAALFDAALASWSINDPYVPERALAAVYGVCMRTMGEHSGDSSFTDGLAGFAKQLLDLVLRPSAPNATWHALTRGYATGVLQVLQRLRPQALNRADRHLLTPAPGQAPSPFRQASLISAADIEDSQSAIHMDFGNYTIGRLVQGRDNYDDEHPEYVEVRRQIADRMRQLGYDAARFAEIDRRAAEQTRYRGDRSKVDRYGKKYAWIAYFEMYGLRRALGKLAEHQADDPRSSDCDIDPSFPEPIPIWDPPRKDVFDSAPADLHGWIASGRLPDYEGAVRRTEVDGHAGDWVLLDAYIREQCADGRELRWTVDSAFVKESSVDRLRTEAKARPGGSGNALPTLGSDYYTYHGEIPWSPAYGSDVRTANGAPRHMGDRAFDHFEHGRWKPGIPVESACRRWEWESYHSQLNQTGSLVFPAPPIAEKLGLRIVAGISDMRDRNGALATVYREIPSSGFTSHVLYMRRDLIEQYTQSRGARLVQVVAGERMVDSGSVPPDHPPEVQALFQSGADRFSVMIGLDS